MARAHNDNQFLPPLWVLTIAALISLGWLMVQLREIVMLLVVGYCISYAIEPVLQRLERNEISRPVGVALILSALVLLLLSLILSAIPTLAREAVQFGQNFPRYIELVIDRAGPYIAFLGDFLPADMSVAGLKQKLLPYISKINGEVVQRIISGLRSTLMSGYSLTLTVVNLALLPLIVFYLSVSFPEIHKRALELAPLLKRNQLKRMASEIDHYVSAFVRGQITVASILFLLYALGLGLVGVELWGLLAFIAGFGNIIPYFGFAIGIVLSTIMALVTFGDFSHVLMVLGVFALVQFLEGMVITPKIIGESVGLSPLTVILALVAAGSLFGLIGIFLAVPVVAALKVLARHSHAWLMDQVS